MLVIEKLRQKYFFQKFKIFEKGTMYNINFIKYRLGNFPSNFYNLLLLEKLTEIFQVFLPKPTEDVGMFARPARDTREKENGRRANILILGQTAGHTYIWAEEWTQERSSVCASGRNEIRIKTMNSFER